MKENSKTKIEERVVLQKFEGDPVPENEIERLEIVDGKIVAKHKIKDGKIVETEEF